LKRTSARLDLRERKANQKAFYMTSNFVTAPVSSFSKRTHRHTEASSRVVAPARVLQKTDIRYDT
jgi:hypothetical protein